ncbi:MAG: hypothetical protein GY870_17770 [archaeon]|nr:hypothetical protein [archaeon]
MIDLDFFYENFDGGFLAIVFSIISIISTIISIIILKKKDNTFSFFTHWLPTYGDTVPKAAAHVFNTSVIVLSPLCALFLLYLSLFLLDYNANQLLISIGLVIGIVASIGQLFVGLIPANKSYKFHALAALFFFGGTALYGIFFGIAELIITSNSSYDFPIFLGLTGFVMAILFSRFIYLLIKINIDPELNQDLPAIWEWLSYLSIILWVIEHGIYIIIIN